MSQVLQVRFGQVYCEWEADDSLHIVRQDNGMHMVLSSTEWNLLLAVAHLHGWPTAPPYSVLQDGSLAQCTRPTEIAESSKRPRRTKDTAETE